MTPLVSVAMAAYNGEKYISEQLQSILNQTYPAIEIVITDDRSTDNTVQVIRNFQEKYSNVFLFCNTENSGINKTFENSFKNCNGDFIAISDQDDIWEPDKIEVMVNEVGKEDAFYCNSRLIDRNGNFLGVDFKSLMNLGSHYSGAPFLLSKGIPGHNILVKTDFIKKLIPFPEVVLFDKWISYCAGANNGIRYIDKPLVRYRQHETNAIGITGHSKNKSHKETAKHKYSIKLKELQTFATAPVEDSDTRIIINRMVALFNRKWSLQRSLFFFKYRDQIMALKKKSGFGKILYCIKMFFKPNY